MQLAVSILVALLASQSDQKPEWCRDLPRPAYSKLERVNVPDKWFEVYRIHPGLFAIYEPHQQEEIISYLIVGQKQALLFDTGMGISNIKKVVEGLTNLPVNVMNSHTHNTICASPATCISPAPSSSFVLKPTWMPMKRPS